MGVAEYVRALLASDKLGPQVRHHRCEPARAAVIEDSPNGVRAGHAAGMQVYLVPDIIAPTPQIEAMTHEVLSTLADLPAAIARA